MIIKRIFAILKFLRRETEIDVLLLTGALISILYFFNPGTELASFAIWLIAAAVLYAIFWIMLLGLFILVLGSGKLDEGG